MTETIFDRRALLGGAALAGAAIATNTRAQAPARRLRTRKPL